MLSWAQQRKLWFVGGVSLSLIGVLSVYAFTALRGAPRCDNDTRDGDERGVDCGGACLKLCSADTTPPLIHFTRALEIESGIWGAVVYAENRNVGAGAKDVPYVFKLYDEENLLIYERRGKTFIPPRKVFAIFEGKMQSGNRTPSRATFEFLEEPTFLRFEEPLLSLSTKGFSTSEEGSSLQATIQNPSSRVVEGIEITALLFGGDGNVIAASATRVKKLMAEERASLVFTWPRELEIPARIEVLYRVQSR